MPRVRGFFNIKNFSLMIDQKEINEELDSYFTLTDSQCWESGALRVLIRLKIATPEELEDRIGGLAAEWPQAHRSRRRRCQRLAAERPQAHRSRRFAFCGARTPSDPTTEFLSERRLL